MAKAPSTDTQLRTTRALLRGVEAELARTRQQATDYRIRATKAEQECAEWKQRFDTLLSITEKKARTA